MKKYLLFICLSIFLFTCESDNSNSVDPVDNEDDTADLVQVDVKIPGRGIQGLAIEFNDASYFFVRNYHLYAIAPIEWDNHFVTYLPRGNNNIRLKTLDPDAYPGDSKTYTKNFVLGDAEKYSLSFLFEDEFEVIVDEVSSSSQ